MGLYFGDKKQKLRSNNAAYFLNLYTTSTSVVNENKLLSSDNYTLKDKNGLFLMAKEDK